MGFKKIIFLFVSFFKMVWKAISDWIESSDYMSSDWIDRFKTEEYKKKDRNNKH